MGHFLVGTSGWSYRDWRGRFYTLGTAVGDYLPEYARTFNTVELNNSFYRQPPPESFAEWAAKTPEQFIFTVKASRYITHLKKLSATKEPLERFLAAARNLGPQLGPILFQFPGNWKANPERLDGFLDLFPDDLRAVFEFRHPSWFEPVILSILKDHGAALCHAYSDRRPISEAVTGDFIYIRLHGRRPTYASRYRLQELRELAGKILVQLEAENDVYVYFNNDANAYAVANALELIDLVKKTGPSGMEEAG